MNYTLENGKTVSIPDKEIEKLQKNLELSENDAIELWLTDNNYLSDEEQNELDNKAKKVKINHEAVSKVRKKSEKPKTHKVSDEKKEIFQTILTNLDRSQYIERENIQILTENKLILVTVGDKKFKIDLIQCRK